MQGFPWEGGQLGWVGGGLGWGKLSPVICELKV